ncbi:MAG: hypothetical protein CL508_05200 [Actinobacteria bacterium]|nr:hypothetical protein [Actinomycetota bacterium]|tara:strand:- start:20027 stop:20374 length:348 start_codon:yes stop_codon:yes gene_type:complete
MKYYYAVDVLKVVDGDTVDVRIDLGFDVWHKCRVRLMGINAPESRTRDKEEKKRGLAAKEWLSKEIYDAVDPIELKSHGKGKFGRILGELFINNININELMVNSGHAVKYDGGKR